MITKRVLKTQQRTQTQSIKEPYSPNTNVTIVQNLIGLGFSFRAQTLLHPARLEYMVGTGGSL